MWLVRNTLKATLTFRGLDVSIESGEQFDLDSLGRDAAESSNQIQVAFEEGYLENVHKASAQPEPEQVAAPAAVPVAGAAGSAPAPVVQRPPEPPAQEPDTALPQPVPAPALVPPSVEPPQPVEVGSESGGRTAPGMSADEFDVRMKDFKRQFLEEMRSQMSVPAQVTDAEELRLAREAFNSDLKELVGEFKQLRGRFDSVKGQVKADPTLSQAEVKARIAFLEEQERNLLKNFETVGREQVSEGDGDVMDKADLLSGL